MHARDAIVRCEEEGVCPRWTRFPGFRVSDTLAFPWGVPQWPRERLSPVQLREQQPSGTSLVQRGLFQAPLMYGHNTKREGLVKDFPQRTWSSHAGLDEGCGWTTVLSRASLHAVLKGTQAQGDGAPSSGRVPRPHSYEKFRNTYHVLLSPLIEHACYETIDTVCVPFTQREATP